MLKFLYVILCTFILIYQICFMFKPIFISAEKIGKFFSFSVIHNDYPYSYYWRMDTYTDLSWYFIACVYCRTVNIFCVV